MKQGEIVTVALPGDYGKPRPAVVIQSDAFSHLHSVTVLPLTSNVLSLERSRVVIEVSEQNGLRRRSQVMVEKASTIPREKAGSPIGRLSSAELGAVREAMAIFFGFS